MVNAETVEALQMLVGILIDAGEQFGEDTETMIRLWCAGHVSLTWDEADESVLVGLHPERPGEGGA